jgi:hypothetical protein
MTIRCCMPWRRSAIVLLVLAAVVAVPGGLASSAGAFTVQHHGAARVPMRVICREVVPGLVEL